MAKASGFAFGFITVLLFLRQFSRRSTPRR